MATELHTEIVACEEGMVESGVITHDGMAFEDWRVRTYGDSAVATCRARSSGTFHGEPFETHEISTSVYVRENGRWLCVLTQLTPLRGVV